MSFSKNVSWKSSGCLARSNLANELENSASAKSSFDLSKEISMSDESTKRFSKFRCAISKAVSFKTTSASCIANSSSIESCQISIFFSANSCSDIAMLNSSLAS